MGEASLSKRYRRQARRPVAWFRAEVFQCIRGSLPPSLPFALNSGEQHSVLPVSGIESGAIDSAPAARGLVPPLLRMLLPLIVAAVVLGVFFAWLFPPGAPAGAAPVPRFTNATAESGIVFSRQPGADEASVPTTLGGGVVFFDCDADGDVDLFLVNGAPWPWEESMAKRVGRGCVLLRNDGTGKFTDVSPLAELNVELQGMGAAAGDFDNDGLPDLFVACVGFNHLYHNRGGGRFEDITERAGVGGDANVWSTSAAWIDCDGDGRLDLVVAHYAQWPREIDLADAFTVARLGRSYGMPTGFLGCPPTVYRNLGGGRFEPASDAAGLRNVDPQTGMPVAKVLAVVPLDANGDRRLDLLFFHHTAVEALFLNRGDGTFHQGTWAGERREGMSARLADPLPFTHTGVPDQRSAALLTLENLVESLPDDPYLRLAGKGGAALLDYDGDGRLDIFSADGRAEPDLNRFDAGRDFSAQPQLFWNRRDGWSSVAAGTVGSEWDRPLVGRGTAVADIDADGDLDVVITQNAGPPRLLRNDQRRDPPWLMVDLVGTRCARDAGGARVEVHTPRRVQVQTVAPAMTFMAQSARPLYFGLGEDARVRRIVVEWPSGQRQEVRVDGVNRQLVVEEP